MTPQKQRIAIAQTCGIKCKVNPFSGNVLRLVTLPGETVVRFGSPVPDYPSDLNAMHEAENTLTKEQQGDFAHALFDTALRIANGPQLTWHVHHATAAQRAEAFLRTIGKWEEN